MELRKNNIDKKKRGHVVVRLFKHIARSVTQEH